MALAINVYDELFLQRRLATAYRRVTRLFISGLFLILQKHLRHSQHDPFYSDAYICINVLFLS